MKIDKKHAEPILDALRRERQRIMDYHAKNQNAVIDKEGRLEISFITDYYEHTIRPMNEAYDAVMAEREK